MPPEPLVLAFDTSVAHCAAALLSGDRILVERTEFMAKGQAERLFPLLEEVISEADKTWGDLTCIGVGIGPGNFTGIRISVAAARGLALSLAVPAIGVSSLEAQAEGIPGTVVSVLDARRENYYLQVFGDEDSQKPALYSDLKTLPKLKNKRQAVVVGYDADQIANFYGGQVSQPQKPLAVTIGQIAGRRSHMVNSRPAPMYLRAADAAPPRDTAPIIL
ncbi:MAG: tRNA (adenosine(37)-N6)-threonylcarbamoyltransferase complex dimerization subunit type 1 TsaB [Paracoccaceae bacterium]